MEKKDLKKKVFSVAFSGLTLLSSVIPSLASTAHAGSDSTPRASAGMEPENSHVCFDSKNLVCFDSKNLVFVSCDPNGIGSLSEYALGTDELLKDPALRRGSRLYECALGTDELLKDPARRRRYRLSKYALGTGELPESLSKAPECPCKVDDTMKVPLKPSHAKGFFKNRVVPNLGK